MVQGAYVRQLLMIPDEIKCSSFTGKGHDRG